MNRNFHQVVLRAALLILSLAVFAFPCAAEINPKPFVIPELKTWTGGDGYFQPSGRIVYKGGQTVEKVAMLMAEDYARLTGKHLVVSKGKARTGDFSIMLTENDELGTEGYSLDISDIVTIAASTERGLIWGTHTVLQMTEQNEELSLPKGSSTDVPEYALRGFMLDCGRKFIPMDYLRNLVKIMSYYKMNTLQVHLNDNGFKQFFGNDWDKTQAAFRLESDTYPGLAAEDGFYTKKEFIDLQKLGEEYGVEIIPEIDVPAHSLAFVHYKPSIGSKEYGLDHLDLFNPDTYTFLDGLFKEYLEGDEPVFRGKRVHIGTDEYSNAKQDVVEQFRYFTDYYIRLMESFGKQAVVWGALTHANGNTPVKSDNVLMNCWYNGYADPREMKKQGYRLVCIPDGLVYIVPAAGYYHDYLNCRYLYDNWTPAVIGKEIFEENDPAIEGGMFAVWNDHVGNGITVKDIHDRIMPAMHTISVKCWTGVKTTLPYVDFDRFRNMLSEAPGVNEAGRLEKGIFHVGEVNPGMRLDMEEVGYDYSVSFTVKGENEEKGTPLFSSRNAIFYLSDPVSGKLGFSRDGYLNTFKYSIVKDTTAVITIEGNRNMTRLLVNGKKVQELRPKALYVMNTSGCPDNSFGKEGLYNRPQLYEPDGAIHYHSTLVFPLRQAGQFKSTVTDLKVIQTKP